MTSMAVTDIRLNGDRGRARLLKCRDHPLGVATLLLRVVVDADARALPPKPQRRSPASSKRHDARLPLALTCSWTFFDRRTDPETLPSIAWRGDWGCWRCFGTSTASTRREPTRTESPGTSFTISGLERSS